MQFTDEHRRKRLSFANGYKDWSEEKWETVMFSDEKAFFGSGFNGRIFVRRTIGESLNPIYCVGQRPHPIKLNVWACFCARGVGYSYIFNDILDSKLLLHVLDSHLLQSAALHFHSDPPEQWHFLQDNDPKHKSRLVQAWLHNHGVACIDFPPYSPDLNPIENLWNYLARRVEAKQAETMEQLQEVVAEEWAAVPLEFIRTLAHSMPARCQAVINANGNHTSY